VTGRSAIERAFPVSAFDRVEAAIVAGEKRHGGELQLAVEASLPLPAVWSGKTPRERALEVFSQLRVWDTERNCGVLIYLLLADHDVEIVADRGIDRVVGNAGWGDICARMEAHFRAGRFVDGVLGGIDEINALLAAHFPPAEDDRDELPNRPRVLD
jgi:uncharacterized membrane protein